ncbi:LTXXQ domain protein [Serpens gallinarum]|uniref:LTXXQ domain protein n=1 Tax=Serpens gallinarum TaxID=2763075 RepID=A0ABR8TS92_9PSED|nr:LTXXQ domain protein [Serpens gallinarum]MBD7978164.1 LTXXQ domain protein [Serpens gallinarum]
MRKTLTALLIAAVLPTMALAMPNEESQQGPKHSQHHRHHGAKAFHDLDLSKDQRREIGKVMGEQMKQRHDIHQRYLDKLPAAEKQAMQKDLKANQDKSQKDIRAVLTPEQIKRFEERQKKMTERRAERAEFKAWKDAKDQKAQ